MGVMALLKARKAAAAYQKGQIDEAMKLYEEAEASGVTDMRYVLAHAVALLRIGEYEKARQLMVKYQRAAMSEEHQMQVRINYAVAMWKLGDMEKALTVLEGQAKRVKNGLLYDTLGYLYIEAGDTEKALAFNQEAMEYDDEDSVTLDNMGQIHYRLLNDPATAKPYFDRAIAIKEGQIDTLWFLSRYDVAEGKTDEAITKLKKALEGRFSPLNYINADTVRRELARLGVQTEA